MTPLCNLIHRTTPLILRPTVVVRQACEKMRNHNASAVLITHADGYLLGIFTGSDAISRVLATGKNADTLTLGEVMTSNPTTISPHTTAIEALRAMWDGGFRHLPVIQNGNVIGLVLRRDFKSEDWFRFEEERELWEHMR